MLDSHLNQNIVLKRFCSRRNYVPLFLYHLKCAKMTQKTNLKTNLTLFFVQTMPILQWRALGQTLLRGQVFNLSTVSVFWHSSSKSIFSEIQHVYNHILQHTNFSSLHTLLWTPVLSASLVAHLAQLYGDC